MKHDKRREYGESGTDIAEKRRIVSEYLAGRRRLEWLREETGGDMPLLARVARRRELRRAAAGMTRVERAVERVADERQRRLLRLHLMEGLTLEKVSEQMQLSPRWTAAIYRDALEKLEI